MATSLCSKQLGKIADLEIPSQLCLSYRTVGSQLMLCRYEKRHSNLAVHVSPCFRVNEGDIVIVGQCRSVTSTSLLHSQAHWHIHVAHMHDVACSACCHFRSAACGRTSLHQQASFLVSLISWPVTVLNSTASEQPTGKASQKTCCYIAIGWSVVVGNYHACVYIAVSG